MSKQQACGIKAAANFQACEGHCQLLIENSLDVISVIDQTGTILYQSPSGSKILGYKKNELIGRDVYEFMHPEDCEAMAAILRNSVLSCQPAGGEYRFRHKNGSWRYFEAISNIVHSEAGNISFVINSRDVTDKRYLEEKLLFEALHDTLTGLPNRNYLMEQLRSTVSRAGKEQDCLFAVILLGIDRFKIVNESLGFSNGDELLRQIAQRLLNVIRMSDSVARLGEDKFAVLLRDVEDVNDVIRVVNRIQHALAPSFQINRQEVFTAASVGIVLSNIGYNDAEELLRNAEIAMNRAKKSSPGSWQIYHSEMYQDILEFLKLDSDLRRAVEKKEFVVHYLPIVSLSNGRMVGVEALVRWQHPERGLIFPDQFIPAAEETGLICVIGEHVLRTACADLKQWRDQGHPDLRVAVNFSAYQFHAQDVPALIHSVLNEFGLHPVHFEMEVTESIIMESQSVAMLQELHDMGLKISIDDFGTGYSSLSYLKKLPSHVLKIDKSFIDDLIANQDDATIAKTIILMAHGLGLKVLAEGVEIKEQLEVLRSLGCDEFQGYYFSRPQPAGIIAKLLGERRTL